MNLVDVMDPAWSVVDPSLNTAATIALIPESVPPFIDMTPSVTVDDQSTRRPVIEPAANDAVPSIRVDMDASLSDVKEPDRRVALPSDISRSPNKLPCVSVATESCIKRRAVNEPRASDAAPS